MLIIRLKERNEKCARTDEIVHKARNDRNVWNKKHARTTKKN